MTDDDAGGRGVKNGDFWMTSFVNDPLKSFVKFFMWTSGLHRSFNEK